MRIYKWVRRHIFVLLDVVKLIGILILIIMFINFNVKVAEQTNTTKEIVASQNIILDAIRDLTIDIRLTSEEKTNTIICMLQVPVEERTTAILDECRQKALSGMRETDPPKAPPLNGGNDQPPAEAPPELPQEPPSEPELPNKRIRSILNNIRNLIMSILDV